MADRVLAARTIQLHDVEDNWNKCTSFIPKAGEIIVYDPDPKCNYTRFKVGDGITTVANLQFVVDEAIATYFHRREDIFYVDGGRIS